MATPATHPIPEGMHSLTAQLWFNGNCKKAIEFYQKVFDAELLGPISTDSKGNYICHAMVRFDKSNVMMADAWPGSREQGPEGNSSVGMWLYVEDCDAVFKRAVDAGCEVLMPMTDAFWGDRMGKVRDPFGHCWAIATYKMVMTDDEIKKGIKEWEASCETHTGCC